MTDDKSLVDAYASIYNKKEKEQIDEAVPLVGAAIGLGKKLLLNKGKEMLGGAVKRGLGMLNPKRNQEQQPAMASYQPEGEMVEDLPNAYASIYKEDSDKPSIGRLLIKV